MSTSNARSSLTRTIHLEIRTGSHLLAGIDSRVWIQLVGDRRRTPWMRIDPEEGSYARNTTALATVTLKEHMHPGEVLLVRVIHDASGSFKGWFLNSVTVDGKEFGFHCWLARDEPPYRTDAASIPEDEARGYTVVIGTSDVFLSGTDADVEIQLVGTRATTAWLRLWEPGVNSFEGGNADTFRVFTEDVGDIIAVWLRHDDSGAGAGWHIEWLDVDGRRTQLNKWLASDEGAGHVDHLWLLRPMLKAKRPLAFRLVTFADIHVSARKAAATDVGHLGAMLQRYGIETELLQDDRDVLLPHNWLPFDARHSTTESLIEAILGELEAAAPQTRDERVIPLFYIGGFEQQTGFYPCAARRPGGIFMPIQPHSGAALPHEFGRYFGLPHSTGRADPSDLESPRTDANAPDVIESDPHNVMSYSDRPVGQQYFTHGQVQRMLLNMLELIG